MPDYKKLFRGKRPSRQIARKTTPLLLLILVIAGICFGGRHFLLNSAIFEIKKVKIIDEKGNPLPGLEGILKLREDKNLFAFNARGHARDIQARHPEFISVVIRKQFPNTALIMGKKRKPVAILVTSQPCMVDGQGFILPYGSNYGDLPRIVGVSDIRQEPYTPCPSPKLEKALELLGELKKARVYPKYKVSQIDVREYSDVVFYLEDKVKVKMGKEDFARKASVLKGILSRLKEEEALPKYIDMRFADPSALP